MKYIIDIEDKPFTKKGEVLYKAKGFNSLVFDEKGLNKMKPFETEAFEILEEVSRLSRLFKKQDKEREAKAERMFKDIGYDKVEDNEKYIIFVTLADRICFDKRYETVEKTQICGNVIEIDKDELKAINQMFYELWWLE